MTSSDVEAISPLPLKAARVCRLAWLYLRHVPALTYQQNERHLLIDGVGVGLMNSVAIFLPVYLNDHSCMRQPAVHFQPRSDV
jgi:hypothetical protein